jgi:hypothetical protein
MHAETLSRAEVPSEEVSETHDASSRVVSENQALSSLARFSANRERSIQRPKFLLSESLQKGDGIGPVMSLDEFCSKLLVVTLDITNVVERTGLTVSIWGSTDQSEWGDKPLITFRQRQYCGVYSVLLNMATHPDIGYLRVQWSMNRWGRTERIPLFGFEVFVEESGARISSSAIA